MFSECINSVVSKVILVVMVMSLAGGISSQSNQLYPELNQKFKEYQLLHLDSKSIYNNIKSGSDLSHFIIKLNNGAEWDLNLRSSKIISPNYNVVIAESDGQKFRKGSSAIPMIGKVNGIMNSEVALTFNENFVYGFIRIGFDEYYIEPVHHLSAQKTFDAFVLYSVKDVLKTELYKCGYEVDANELKRVKENSKNKTGNRMPGQCFEIKYNTASDWSMRVKYGSITGVENHNIGVLNDVQTNYDNEFADEIQFVMMQQFIVACATCDPWTASTNSSTLLNSFTNWAQSGFTTFHDLAGLWTNRNMDSGVVGVAWLGVLCTSSKYHVLQDFTGNAPALRVMVAHEIGHNFNASHDGAGSGFIMAPSVNITNTWSSSSISAIQTEYLSASCLDNCAGGTVPSADFNFTILNECLPGQVQYFDLSTNAASRVWTFPGGSPSTSTAQNPIINYNTQGTYGATLVATNNLGSNSFSVSNVITVIGNPTASFDYFINGSTVDFIFTGNNNATDLFWEFGDGNSVNGFNPSHTYLQDGSYTVTLTASNSCFAVDYSVTLTIATAPVANFNSNIVAGCQPLTVSFVNQSTSNATSFLWTFPGGSPSTSTLPNPTVVYNSNSSYNVSLKAINNIGNDTELKTNYITVQLQAISAFVSVQNGASITTTNNSQYATSYLWNFGDGETSTSTNPRHTYSSNGVYTITLSATNNCGTISSTQQITVALAPIASFLPSTNTSLCANQTLSFQSTTTYNPATFLWTFEGGTPSTSTEANPVVSYVNGGVFDVQLIVTNVNGSDTLNSTNLITVNTLPEVLFSYIGDGLSVNFASQIVNGINPSWNFGDGQTSIQLNPINNYNSEGNYAVTLTANNGCGIVDYTQNILVQLLPTASFSSNISSGCNPVDVIFTSESSPSVTSWLWAFEGGTPSTSTERNPVVTYENTGVFNVSLTVSNVAGQNTSSLMDYITINTVPDTGFDFVVDSNQITLTNIGMGANITNWSLIGPGRNTQISGSPAIFTADQNGIFSMTQTNINQCGQSTSNIFNLTISAFPESAFAANLGGTICEDASVLFTNQSLNGTSYSWDFTGGSPATSNEVNPNVTYQSPGIYAVKLITYNNLGNDTLISNIAVGSKPSAAFDYTLASSIVNFEFKGLSTSSVKWYFGDNIVSTDLNPTHNYANTGTYTVKLVSENICGQDSTSKTFSIIGSAVVDAELERNLFISPNPNQGLFRIFIKEPLTGEHKIVLSDMFGRQIFNQIIQHTGVIDTEIDVTNLPPATYFLKVSNRNGVASKQIVITR
ncbi:MAG: PKD domain-containing protein [Saprospiraceae bacterium]|nr:PKD domain-containing protein [Saprospiraceae bacterium]